MCLVLLGSNCKTKKICPNETNFCVMCVVFIGLPPWKRQVPFGGIKLILLVRKAVIDRRPVMTGRNTRCQFDLLEKIKMNCGKVDGWGFEVCGGGAQGKEWVDVYICTSCKALLFLLKIYLDKVVDSKQHLRVWVTFGGRVVLSYIMVIALDAIFLPRRKLFLAAPSPHPSPRIPTLASRASKIFETRLGLRNEKFRILLLLFGYICRRNSKVESGSHDNDDIDSVWKMLSQGLREGKRKCSYVGSKGSTLPKDVCNIRYLREKMHPSSDKASR